MDTQPHSRNREWTILCHNIKGINFERKWNSIQNKIQETKCDIICIQDTKREHFDLEYLKKFTTREFNNYSFIPSSRNSGGTFISWKGSKFHRAPVFENSFA
jgi:exonuclease III